MRNPNGSYFEIYSYPRNVSSFIRIICLRVYFVPFLMIFISHICFLCVLCVILQSQLYGLTFLQLQFTTGTLGSILNKGTWYITHFLYCTSHTLGKLLVTFLVTTQKSCRSGKLVYQSSFPA